MKINSKIILNENYGGLGGNLWTGCLSDEGISVLNMSEAYFEVNAKRIMTVKPKMMRIMVMPQYIVDFGDGKSGEENWKKGIYDFNSSYMHNFWRYCEVFKAAGTKVELNFGGATSKKILDWFGLPGMCDSEGGTRSGPADLKSWGLATASIIKEAHKRGFGDTIKFINFYNESGHANYGAFGDKRVYWCKMIEYVHNALVEFGLRDSVTIIGADDYVKSQLGSDVDHKEWLDYIYENAALKGICDTMSVHIYFEYDYQGNDKTFYCVEDTAKYCKDIVSTYSGMKRDIMVTEFGLLNHKDSPLTEGGDGRYCMSLCGQLMAQANAGISKSAYWFFCGSYIPEPICNFQTGGLQLWEVPSYKGERQARRLFGVESVNSTFGLMGLMMRYVKDGSKVAELLPENENFRTAAFLMEEDTTILVEVNHGDGDRAINIDLDGRTGKTYYKHLYVFPENDNMVGAHADSQYDANAVLPQGTEINTTGGSINDSVGSGHYLVVYTTLPNAQQVLLKETEIEIERNETATVELKGVIALDSDEVEYSIMPDGKTGEVKGSLEGNVYIPSADAKSGDTVAIKVASTAPNADRNDISERYNTDAYAVAVVKIK